MIAFVIGLALIIAGLMIAWCNTDNYGDEVLVFGGIFVAIIGFILLVVGFAAAVDDSNVDGVTNDLKAAYHDQLRVTNVTNDTVAFDLVNTDGTVRIHCDGKVVTNTSGHYLVASESLTQRCSQELAAVSSG